MRYPRLVKAAAILAILVLGAYILVHAKPFLVPLTFAGILAMVLLPISRWLEGKGMHKVLAIVLSLLVLVSFFVLAGFFIGMQLSDIAGNTSRIEQQATSLLGKAQQTIAQQLGIPAEQQQQMLKEQQSSSGNMSGLITGFLGGVGSLLTNTILVLVYIFLFLYFRGKLKGFITRLVPEQEKGNALRTVDEAQKVAQRYLSGMVLMIVGLWIMYFIGFSIAGVKNAFFFAILCGLLELIPFVGNLAGTTLTIILSLAQGGDARLVMGIVITYVVVQFIQSYLLEPLVVGSEVSINPLFTIVGLVAGEELWGIAGLILAIPLLGMARIICDHVAPLRPYAYLIGEDKKPEQKGGFRQKVADWFK